MAPIRRYLRITKHSVLEVRIYLDRPSDAEWLLRHNNPVLPRVIEAVRPLVLPKLREENERARRGGGGKAKKKGVKDVVVEDDFDVSIFLTELSSRHSVLTKKKVFKDKPRIKSNSGKLTRWLTTAGTSEQPMLVDDDDDDNNNNNNNKDAGSTVIREEEDDDDMIDLAAIPEVGDSFVNEKSREDKSDEDEEEDDDKKKLALNTSYEGFSIYGRILCLVVKRKGRASSGGASSQRMMENWVSTQAAAEQADDDEDNG